jgi:hypothetical protein
MDHEKGKTEELKLMAAKPFKMRGKSRLTPSEFLFSITIGLKWFSHEDGKIAMEEAKRAGYLRLEGGKLVPAFNIHEIEVPDHFRPTENIFIMKPLMERIIEKMGIERHEALEIIDNKRISLYGLVIPEVAGMIVLKEKDIDVSQFLEEAYELLL